MDMESTSQYDSLVADSEIFEAVSESRDKSVNSETFTLNEVTCSKPFVGMEFETLHQAFLFYNEYAAIVGFSVRKDKTRKSNIDGSYLFRRFCCSKEGHPRNSRENSNDRSKQGKEGGAVKVEARIQLVTTRIGRRAKLDMKRRAEILQKMRVGCNAKLDVKRTTEGKWVVQKFVEEHNHECVSLGETHLLRSHRGRQATQGQIDRCGVEEIPPSDELRTLNEVTCEKPSVGMEFESHHKAFLFYNAYARIVGFIVRKDKTRKSNKDGSLLFRRFCCSKEGYRRKNCEEDNNDRKQVRGGIVVKVRPRILPVTRVGCNAKLEVKKSTDGKWVVQKFIEEHNHECDRLGEMQLLRSHKQIQSTTQTQVVDAEMDAVARPKKVASYLITREAAGSEKVGSFEPRLRNRINKKKRKKLEKGDAQVLFNYFRQMQTENPSFFYSIQVDEEDQMLNCFWADARSRMDFGYFGDVICFETSYGTSKYGRPFAPILGVNHHAQTVLFGCAILLNETEESFSWLLETLLKAMHGCHPVTIISDQDEEMEKAMEQVLPGTHHHLSLWHIFQNTAKFLSHLYTNESSFTTDFKKCIYEPLSCGEFESRWASLLENYELCGNEWLDNIYKKRHKWVPIYSKHVFHADMTTTQRNESVHSFFNGYLNKSLTLTEFINQYEKALGNSREKETYEDFRSHQTRHVLKSDLPMEKQAADIYTRSMFKEFHKEFCDSFNFIAVETETPETNRTFVLSRWGQNRNFLVKMNSCDNDIQVTCSCQNFEFMGSLCRHILKVFTATNVILVPEVYLKKRWTKRAKWGVVLDETKKEMQADYLNSLAFRHSDLFHLALNLSAKGAFSMKAYQIAKSNIEAKLRELEKVSEEDPIITHLDNGGIRSSFPPIEVIKNNESSKYLVSEDNQALSTASQAALCDPPHVRTRGRPPKRITPLLGEIQGKKKTRTVPESNDYNAMPSHSSNVGVEPNAPCNVGGRGDQDIQNHSRLLNVCPNICMYACAPPGPSGDMNDQYHSSDTPSFGEPFAGLHCIQTSEPNIFDLNQELTVGPSNIQNSQTSHFDLNQVNHVARTTDSWLLPSSGWIKLNFVGSSKEICLGSTRRRVAGFGGTISISDGSIIKAYAGPAGEVQAVDAEILALWNGLKILSSLPSRPVWIEGDSQPVIKWLRKESDIPWRFTPTFFDIESIMSKLALGRITHTHREGNSMADKLANEGLTKDSLIIWDQMPSL